MDAALKRLGLTMNSVVSMRTILDQLGVSDTVYSFCKVKPESQKEADHVLHTYMEYLYDIALNRFGAFDPAEYPMHAKAIRKRCQGIYRPKLLAEASIALTKMKAGVESPERLKALDAMLCLSSTNHADAIAATHAGVALMDACRASGAGEALAEELRAKLEELMPT